MKDEERRSLVTLFWFMSLLSLLGAYYGPMQENDLEGTALLFLMACVSAGIGWRLKRGKT